MNVQQTYNTIIERIENKEHNILIPICLGNKFFTYKNTNPTKNLKEYISWSIKHSKERPAIIIIDDIQISNYQVRNSTSSYQANKNRIQREGQRIKENTQSLLDKNFPQSGIDILRYADYIHENPQSQEITNLTYKEFKNNSKFQEAIFNTTKKTVTDRAFSDEKYWLLCDYLLDEFALCNYITQHNNTNYDLMIYPNNDPTLELFVNISQQKAFQKFDKKIIGEKNNWAILR